MVTVSCALPTHVCDPRALAPRLSLPYCSVISAFYRPSLVCTWSRCYRRSRQAMDRWCCDSLPPGVYADGCGDNLPYPQQYRAAVASFIPQEGAVV